MSRLSGAVAIVDGTSDRLLSWLGRVPTTNLRIVVTLVVFVGTGGRYLSSDTWAPSIEWLGFIVAMAGVDSLTFFAKRKTHNAELPKPEPEV